MIFLENYVKSYFDQFNEINMEIKMDFVIGIIILVLVLFLEIFAAKLNTIPIFKKIEEKSFIFSQKLLIAALAGFSVYVVITPQLDSILHKLVIVIIAGVFISAVFIKVPSLKD